MGFVSNCYFSIIHQSCRLILQTRQVVRNEKQFEIGIISIYMLERSSTVYKNASSCFNSFQAYTIMYMWATDNFSIFTVFKYVGSTFVERCKLIFGLIPPETLGFNFLRMSRRQRLVPEIL